MTHSEARKRAVEAAYDAVQRAMTTDYRDGDEIERVFREPIEIFLATMADAGWRMAHDDNPTGFARGFIAGQAACRAAMLEGE